MTLLTQLWIQVHLGPIVPVQGPPAAFKGKAGTKELSLPVLLHSWADGQRGTLDSNLRLPPPLCWSA